jgi:uncharacterized membrane protein
MLFAYLGPETVLPLTSVVAAIVGIVLMLGRQIRSVAAYLLRRVRVRPHLERRARAELSRRRFHASRQDAAADQAVRGPTRSATQARP